ncbi:MAG: DNA translocase FtsK [Candidatus Wallbacteria bacterium]
MKDYKEKNTNKISRKILNNSRPFQDDVQVRKNSEIIGLLYILSSIILLLFFVLKPSESRYLGSFYNALLWLKVKIGVTMYLFSFLLWYCGIQKIMHGYVIGRKYEYFGYFLLLLSSNIFFEILNGTGGLLGRTIVLFMVKTAGNAGSLVISIFGVLIGISMAFNILLAPLFEYFVVKFPEMVWAFLKGVVFYTAFAITFVFELIWKFVISAADFLRKIFRRGDKKESENVQSKFESGYSVQSGVQSVSVKVKSVAEELSEIENKEAERNLTKQPDCEKNNEAAAAAASINLSESVAKNDSKITDFLKNFASEEVKPGSFKSNMPETPSKQESSNLGEKESETPQNKPSIVNITVGEALKKMEESEKKAASETEQRPSNVKQEDGGGVPGGADESKNGEAEHLREALSRVSITKTYINGAKSDSEAAAKAEAELFNSGAAEDRAEELSKRREHSEETLTANYKYPELGIILDKPAKIEETSEEELKATAEKMVNTFKNFNIEVKVIHITQGPTVTRYELQPATGVKVAKIVSLSDDIALSLATTSLRMEAPIPGKAAIGIEVPNPKPVPVYFSELIMMPEFKNAKSPLLFALGKTITGQPIIADLRNMPHLLIAGTTGSGKSVCINTIITSLLCHARPDEVKLIMVDPKMVELTGYNDIPHLIHPVIVETKEVPFVLEWGIYEMERRYRLLQAFGIRSIENFNMMVDEYVKGEYDPTPKELSALAELSFEGLEKLPYVVFFIDELADLIMTDKSNKIEDYICRLAQKARAIGIHLVVATQRPSVNVITGLIKANLPSRIAFSVSSVTDSRTILDCKGAEKLIGKGDMLYFPSGLSKPVRVQGAYVKDSEIKKLTDFLKKNYEPGYSDEVKDKISEYRQAEEGGEELDDMASGASDPGIEEIINDAVRLVIENKMGSASMLQRTLKIGHNRALKLMERMEKMGVVGPFEDKKPRKVLWTLADYESRLKNVA